MRGRVAVLLASLLAACSVGPQYSPPELDVPAAFRAEVGVPTKESLADLSWWDVYRDPTLRDLLKTAVDQNRDIKIAAARVTEARAQAAIARVDIRTRNRCGVLSEQNAQSILRLRYLASQLGRGCFGGRQACVSAIDVDAGRGAVTELALREIEKTLPNTDGALRDA